MSSYRQICLWSVLALNGSSLPYETAAGVKILVGLSLVYSYQLSQEKQPVLMRSRKEMFALLSPS